MATTARVRKGRTLKRRIIQRPRLLALLDGSKARVRTLVAPAGYGKSTLAEQWVGQDGRRGTWFVARRASTDVAALALGLAKAASEFVPECDERLRQHLRALPTPAENVEVLAEILGEDLEAWPAHAWLVFDEYQEITPAADAERFVEALVAVSPVQLLIASRQRPAWVTERSILYGDVLELTQAELAMDDEEAGQVLANRDAPSAAELVALADGWPAVLGLASVSTANVDESKPVSDSLYRFFAEEVFSSLADKVQRGLDTLAVAPSLDRELASELLASTDADAVLREALDVGVLVERGSQLELHPLARRFLDERRTQMGFTPSSASLDLCLVQYWRRRDWDSAFEVISRSNRIDQLEPLLLEALDDLLETARLSTVETWCDLADRSRLKLASVLIARAEVALRYARLTEAQALAQAAVRGNSDQDYRALSVAALAAHLGSREEEALELYSRAEQVAPNDTSQRDARHGQLLCLTELELPEAVGKLEHFADYSGFADPREKLRIAGVRLFVRHRFGVLDLAEADLAAELIETVEDPLVESGFLSSYASSLAIASRYQDGLAAARSLLTISQRYRLEFATPYAYCTSAICLAGMRQWLLAETSVEEAISASRTGRNAYAEQLSVAARLRMLTQQGKFDEALELDVPRQSMPAKSVRAELCASRALVLAAGDRIDEAISMVDDIAGTTKSVEPVVLIAAVVAICKIKRGHATAIDSVRHLEEVAFSTGGLDALVVAYRSVPELLTALLRGSNTTSRVARLVRDVQDDDLAEALGAKLSAEIGRQVSLSAREREVYELLLQGLTNRQIAALLYIEESTVKVHAHHIYDKTGIRSRRALAARAALRKPSHATSAMDSTSIGDGEAS